MPASRTNRGVRGAIALRETERRPAYPRMRIVSPNGRGGSPRGLDWARVVSPTARSARRSRLRRAMGLRAAAWRRRPICRWCGAPTRASDRDARAGLRSAAGASATRGRCASYQAAQRAVVLAGREALPQRLWMDGAEHRSALSVRDGHFDLHRARCVDHDAVERPAFPDKRHELAFVKGPHLPTLLATTHAGA
jgi:hypothetical protein